MKKILKPLCLVAMATMLAACGSSESPYSNSVEYLPFKTEKSHNWGLIGTDGKVLFEDEFENEPRPAYNGRFQVRNAEDLYEMYTTDAKPKKVGKEYKDIALFREDVAPAVEPGQPVTLIDRDGNVKAKLDKLNGKTVNRVYNFVDGMGIVCLSDGTQGCINTSGKLVVEPEWCDINYIGDGKMVAVNKKYADKPDDEKRVSVIDYSGNVLFETTPNKFTIISPFHEGLAVAFKDLESGYACGIINDKGEWVVSPKEKYREIFQVKNGMFTYFDPEGKCGLNNTEGETLLRAKYDALIIYDNDKLLIVDDGERKIATLEGEDIFKTSYETVAGPFNGNYVVSDGKNSYFFTNEEGEPLDKTQNLYTVETGDEVFAEIVQGSIEQYREFIDTDFADLEALTQAMQLGADGFLGMKVNAPVTDILKLAPDKSQEPQSYTFSSYLRFEKAVDAYEAECLASFDKNMATADYSTSTYAWSDARATMLCAELRLSGLLSDKGAKISEAFAIKLIAAGWGNVQRTPHYRVFKKGSYNAIIFVGDSSLTLKMGNSNDENIAQEVKNASYDDSGWEDRF